MHYIYCLVILLLKTFFINISTSTAFKHQELKQNVELYEENNDFNKYWPLFDQFHSCTIHFSRTLNGWLDMHNSFLERCRYLGYCIALQTSYLQSVSNESSILLEAWNQTDFGHLKITFWTMFLPHRFHQVCTVQLNFSCHHLQSANVGDRFLFSAISPDKSYIILPVDFEIDSTSPFFGDIEGPSLATSKLICLNRNITATYMACLTCNTKDVNSTEIGEIDRTRVKPLIKLDFLSILLGEIDTIWHYYHSNKNNINTKSVTVKKSANLYYDQACVYIYEGKQHPKTDFQCNKEIIETFFNFSEDVVPDAAFSPNRESQSQKYLHFIQKTTCSPAGAQFSGIRYSIFAKSVNHKSFGDSMVTLLSPFSYTHWAFVIACIFLLAATLQLTGFHMQHALFWIIASIMEQGDYRKDQISNKTGT